MATVKTIYFQDEVAKLLEKEENVSRLINNLVKQHFAKREKPEEKARDLESEVNGKILELEMILSELQEKEREKLKELEDKKKREEKRLKEQAEAQLEHQRWSSLTIEEKKKEKPELFELG